MDTMDVKHFLDQSQAADSNSAAKVRLQERVAACWTQRFFDQGCGVPVCLLV